MGLTLLESQPSFPHEDISNNNADMLELLLANETFFHNNHAGAESSYPRYRLGHDLLTSAVRPILDDEQRLAAFSYGIGAYENIGGLMRPTYISDNKTDAERIMGIAGMLDVDFISISSDSREYFSDELPRVEQVIAQTALRHHEGYTDYAITGAAIAARLELRDITL